MTEQWQLSVPQIAPEGSWLIVCPLGDSGAPKGPRRCVFAESPQEFIGGEMLFWSEPVALPPFPEGFGERDEAASAEAEPEPLVEAERTAEAAIAEFPAGHDPDED